MDGKFLHRAASLAAGALLAGAMASAQTGTTASTKGSDTSAMAAADKSFVLKAARGGLAEVELGRLAAEKASDPAVKQFGQRMVDDHSKANDELKTIAERKGVTLPTELDAKDKRTRDHLAKLSGAAFDRAYMRDMVMDHTTDVSEFRKQSKSGKDADVKAFAGKTLPTLEDHLKMARETKTKLGGGKTEASTKSSS